jgi:hypothetical protein
MPIAILCATQRAKVERLNHDIWVGGVIEPRGPLCAGLSARALRHHARLNDPIIGGGSFLALARSFPGLWNSIARTSDGSSNSSGSLAMFAAIRRASSFVSSSPMSISRKSWAGETPDRRRIKRRSVERFRLRSGTLPWHDCCSEIGEATGT